MCSFSPLGIVLAQSRDMQMGRDVRLRGVGRYVDLFNRQDVVGWVAAEVERVVAGDLVVFLDPDLVAAHPRWRRGDGHGAEAGEEEGGELHVGGRAKSR
jgi:hypothetical protein